MNGLSSSELSIVVLSVAWAIASKNMIFILLTITGYCIIGLSIKTSLYLELKDKGIKVQVLCPGVTMTDFAKNYYSKEIYDETMKKSKGMSMTPEKVVDYSLKCLKKNKLVCVPGSANKLMANLFPSLPAGLYGSLVTRMTSWK
jgi:short-subunit dehydrogenase